MRSFADLTGTEWEVIVGRESWGTVVAIFVRKVGGEPPRQTLLPVSSWDEGTRVLMEASEEDLRSLLASSQEKPTE